MKAGTAEIQSWLSQHPSLYRWMGSHDSGGGEAHFFDSLPKDGSGMDTHWRENYLFRGLALPRGLKDARELYTFEKTPGNANGRH